MDRASKIHVTYVLGIAAAIIVGLITVEWASIPDLAALLSFALTLASLLLAILAIGYALYSNTSLGRVFARMVESSDTLKSVSASLTEQAAVLAARVDSLPPLLADVVRSNEATHALMKGWTEKGTSGEAEASPSATTSKPLPVVIASKGSMLGTLGLYAASRAFRAGTGFDVVALGQVVPELADVSYYYGYLIAVSSTGLTSVKANGDIWTIRAFDEELRKAVEDALQRKIKRVEKEEPRKAFEEAVVKIDQYFPIA